MSSSFKRRLAIWAWNGVQYIIGGLATTGLAIFGVETTNVIVPRLTMHFSWHQMLATFLSSGAISLFMYLKTPEGKLPPIDTTPGTTAVPLITLLIVAALIFAPAAFGDITISVAIRPPRTGEHFVATLQGDREPSTPLLTSECITVAGDCRLSFPLIKLPVAGSFCIGPKGGTVGHCDYWVPVALKAAVPPIKRRAVRH